MARATTGWTKSTSCENTVSAMKNSASVPMNVNLTISLMGEMARCSMTVFTALASPVRRPGNMPRRISKDRNRDDRKQRVIDKRVEERAEEDQHDRDDKNDLGDPVHGRRELSLHRLCPSSNRCRCRNTFAFTPRGYFIRPHPGCGPQRPRTGTRAYETGPLLPTGIHPAQKVWEDKCRHLRF